VLIDAFPYAYGPEVLLLRFRELVDVVDLHVMVEADRTHTGVPRDFDWADLKELPEFAPFAHKVEWRGLTQAKAFGSPWLAEEYLRSSCLLHAKNVAVSDDDVILLADHDEIPNPRALARVMDDGIGRARLWGSYHEWFLDLRASGSPGHIWEFRQPITLRAGDPAATGFEAGADLRALQWMGYSAVELGKEDSALRGWHMTLQGGAAAVRAKFRACAHTELQRFTLEQIELRIGRRLDILDRCALVETGLLPQAAHDDYFKEMLCRS
jgi:hypothetical protein